MDSASPPSSSHRIRQPDRHPFSWPPYLRQATYAGTGALAGLSVVPIELVWDRLVAKGSGSWVQGFKQHGPALIGRAAVRFWMFDHAKHQIDSFAPNSLPVWAKGAVSGATGGCAEVIAQSLINGRLPQPSQVGLQTCRLFCAFGTYTYLSTSISSDGPPSPAILCWLCGASAGAVASTVIGAIEGVKPTQMIKTVVPKGSLIIGTTIAVQVISCDSILRRVNP